MTEPRHVWELPDALLLKILCFCAAPTHRAHVLCHQLAPLHSEAAAVLFRRRDSLWGALLQLDYQVMQDTKRTIRCSKRLKKDNLQRVVEAQKLINDHTEIAFHYIWEMANAKVGLRLSKSNFLGILDEYGPHLRYNKVVSSGGIFIVEVCRARHVTEAAILTCVKILVERGALVNGMSHESVHSRQTALCVAAVRGMAKVVSYLLQQDANPLLLCSGRFQLNGANRSIRCKQKTAYDFCSTMLEAERAADKETDLTKLKKCKKLLENP